MKRAMIFAGLLLFVSITSCVSSLIKKDEKINGSLVIMKYMASGGYFSGLGYTIFGDEQIYPILKSKTSDKSYECSSSGNGFCFYANIPAGKYTIEKAKTLLKIKIVMVPIDLTVNFREQARTIEIKESKTYYFGEFKMKLKQDGTELIIEDISEVKENDQANAEYLSKFINQDNTNSGWSY